MHKTPGIKVATLDISCDLLHYHPIATVDVELGGDLCSLIFRLHQTAAVFMPCLAFIFIGDDICSLVFRLDFVKQ